MSDHIVTELMLSQYRASRLEETVTRNVFRVMWLFFSIYVASAASSGAIEQGEGNVFQQLHLIEPLALTAVTFVLFLISSRVSRHLHYQSHMMRELLVSFDVEHKDFYVEGLHRQSIRFDGHYSLFQSITSREELFWCATVLFIVYLRLFAFFFQS